jgi:oligopeptidase A
MDTSAPSRDANPLLLQGGLPRFDLVEPEHVVPGLRTLLAELEHDFAAIERHASASWQGVVEPLERMNDRLALAWGTAGHLMGVRNSEPLREAYEAIQPDVVTFSLRVGQSRSVYRALKELRDGPGWAQLDGTQQRIVSALVRRLVLDVSYPLK